MHITLDCGATLNFAKLQYVLKMGFRIYPNSQLSVLGDKVTPLQALGEIDETFKRDTWTVRFRGLVVEQLAADMFGGTAFLHENDIAIRQATK